ncbi:hypothetical protein F2Q69_00003173 [Brassica cretica]|uniref:DUF7870 domain-containing protein n=1 Tax=Brassica cretica TaxID=69181 RepID=A0A8S9PBB2_BRACR|nr:hypothetical protein F2Q69_00003173 [Brassica cretica]
MGTMKEWLKENVKDEKYVVMKAEVEVMEEIMRSKTIKWWIRFAWDASQRVLGPTSSTIFSESNNTCPDPTIAVRKFRFAWIFIELSEHPEFQQTERRRSKFSHPPTESPSNSDQLKLASSNPFSTFSQFGQSVFRSSKHRFSEHGHYNLPHPLTMWLRRCLYPNVTLHCIALKR